MENLGGLKTEQEDVQSSFFNSKACVCPHLSVSECVLPPSRPPAPGQWHVGEGVWFCASVTLLLRPYPAPLGRNNGQTSGQTSAPSVCGTIADIFNVSSRKHNPVDPAVNKTQNTMNIIKRLHAAHTFLLTLHSYLLCSCNWYKQFQEQPRILTNRVVFW